MTADSDIDLDAVLVVITVQGQKEIAACAESRFFPLFAINFMYSLMYSLLKIAVSRFLGKIIAIFFCPCNSCNIRSVNRLVL